MTMQYDTTEAKRLADAPAPSWRPAMNRLQRRRLARCHIATMLGQMDAPDIADWDAAMSQAWVDVARILADQICPSWRNANLETGHDPK